jgi:hypothetical protein
MHVAGQILVWTLTGGLASLPTAADAWHEVVTQPFVIPGGVADPAGRNGFLANVDGGISAIDLRSGKVYWESKRARRPLFVRGERLYASAPAGSGQLRVVALDVLRNGEIAFESDPIAVPLSTSPHPQTLRWTSVKDYLSVTWEESGDSVRRGGALVDLRTGHVQALPDGFAASDETPKSPVDLSKRVIRWQGFVGVSYKALVLEETATGQKLVLQSWDASTGQAQPAHELLQGERLIVRPTLNDRYLCLRDTLPSPDQKADERGRHAWSIFDVATGERVARLPFEAGTLAIAVLGSRAYCLVAGGVPGSLGKAFVNPRVLKAVDLRTGKVLWERPAEGKRLTPVGT